MMNGWMDGWMDNSYRRLAPFDFFLKFKEVTPKESGPLVSRSCKKPRDGNKQE